MIIGIDEVNFSPSLVGDCIVCALARRPGTRKAKGVKDSKQLTPKRRLELFGEFQKTSIYSIALATVNDIKEHGIYLSRNLAIISAFNALYKKLWETNPGFFKYQPLKIIIDGYFSKLWLGRFSLECHGLDINNLINGDEKVYEISAASIVAKVYMDSLFKGFGSFYPGYEFEDDHGSPSQKHCDALRIHGPTPYHRTGIYAKEWWRKILKKEEK